MKRRTFLHASALALPSLALAQATPPGAAQATVGVLFSFVAQQDRLKDMRDEFARLGWREGANLRLELRMGDARPERVDALARELLALSPALVIVNGDDEARAVKRLDDRIPIVIVLAGDAVADGLATSLQRPGGSVTGLQVMFDDIRPKLMQLARQLAPRARRLAAMYFDPNPKAPNARRDSALERGHQLARQVNAEYLPLPVRDASEIEAAIASLTPVSDHFLLLNFDPVVAPQYARIAAIARAARLPSASQGLTYAQEGGLMSYGPDLSGYGRRAVQLADKVLRGARPGDIPIEQPMLIRLVLNQRTAKEIGLTIPQSLLLRADEVIQ